MKPVIVLVGPTGVGKTKLSIALAKAVDGEIISGDAYQIYKQLSIGSAKITKEEMEDVPHYLVDMYDYRTPYNVKIFQSKARNYIDDIHRRNKIPILCGGTGLYIKAAIYDYEFVDEEIDEAYEAYLESKTNEQLYSELIEKDKESTKTIHANNRKRVKRALMMLHLGHKKSEILAKQTHEPLYDTWMIGLTMERSSLYTRINERVEKMMEDGLEDEVTSLVTSMVDFNLQSMQGIGYKEWKPYFDKKESKEEVTQAIQKNTRNFAKRQYTWFRNQMSVNWYEASEEEVILKDTKNWLKKKM